MIRGYSFRFALIMSLLYLAIALFFAYYAIFR